MDLEHRTNPVFSEHFPAVSWNYSSEIPPTYFLVTFCTEKECASESVPGLSRSLSLETLKGNPAYFVTIQAVRVHGDKAHVSPTEMASIIAPNLEFTDKVSLTTTASPTTALSTVRQQAVNV